MVRPLLIISTVFLFAAACTTEPRPALKPAVPAPTLLVTNASCDSGPCVPFDVGVVPGNFSYMSCPELGCYVSLATVDSRSLCIRLPDTLSETVLRWDTQGHVIDSTHITWTPDVPAGLVATPLTFDRQMHGGAFIPANSPGWSISIPGAWEWAGPPLASRPCRPPAAPPR